METKLELKRKAFEYILYKMVVWYIEFNKIKSTRDFNIQNDFTKVKMRLLPFIACMASRDRKTMFSIFDEFFAHPKDGMLEKDLIDYPFKPDYWYRLQLERNQVFYDDHIDQDLEHNTLDCGDKKISLSKKDLCIEGVPYQIIDKAIDHLKKCNIHFVNLDENWMTAFNKKHTCYAVGHLFEDFKIPLEILLKEKSNFAADVELLHFT